MPQLLNALRFLLLIRLSLKSYLFHMHKRLPTIPPFPPYHLLPSTREIHLFKDLFSVNQQPICLAPKKLKSKIWSLSVLSILEWTPFPHTPHSHASFFNSSVWKANKFFAPPILPKLIKSRLCFQAPKIHSSSNSSLSGVRLGPWWHFVNQPLCELFPPVKFFKSPYDSRWTPGCRMPDPSPHPTPLLPTVIFP